MEIAFIAVLTAGLLALLVRKIRKYDRAAWIVLSFSIFLGGLGIRFNGAVVRPEHAIGALVVLALANRLRTARGGIPKPAFHFLYAWVALLAVSSLLWAREPISSLYIVVWITTSLTIALAAGSWPEKRQRLVGDSLLVLGGICSLSVTSWLTGWQVSHESFLSRLQPGESTLRIVGFAYEPNIMGGMCCLWVALAFHWWADLQTIHKVSTVIVAVAGVLTLTRSVWVSLALSFTLSLLGNPKLRRAALPIALFALSTLSVGLVFEIIKIPKRSADFADRLATLVNFGEGTGAFRAAAWRVAVRQLDERSAWLHGFGANSFQQNNFVQVESKRIDYLSNAWLAQIYDGGVVALALLVLGLLVCYTCMVRKRTGVGVLISVLLTCTTTNSLWFVFPWLALSLIEYNFNEAARKKRGRGEYPKVGTSPPANLSF